MHIRRAEPLVAILLALVALNCQKTKREFQSKSNDLPKGSYVFDDFKAIWVNPEYYKKVTKTLSLYEGYGVNSTDLTISDTSGLSWNYHEGVTLVKDRINGDTLFLRCLDNADYSIYGMLKNDSTFECHNCEKDKVTYLVRATRQVKDSNTHEVFRGYPDYYRRHYFGGLWNIRDVIGNTVMHGDFETMFKMPGFEYVQYEEVCFDYADDMPQMDLVEFSNDAYDRKWFNFKMFGDSIYLYDVIPENRTENDSTYQFFGANSKRGELHYILTRPR